MAVNKADYQRHDLELVESIRSGGAEEAQEAKDELVARHRGMVQATIRQALFKGRCLNIADHLHEVTQDAWLYAFHSIKDVRQNVPGWLYRVSLSTASHHLRRCISDEHSLRQLTPEEETQPSAPQFISYPEARDADEVFKQLAKEAAKISPRFRDIFVLHNLHGWSLETISEYLGESLDAVRAVYYRGCRKLRQYLLDS